MATTVSTASKLAMRVRSPSPALPRSGPGQAVRRCPPPAPTPGRFRRPCPIASFACARTASTRAEIPECSPKWPEKSPTS